MTKKFSAKKINYLLKAKMHDKHNISKSRYIELCREKWEEKNGGMKVIIDKLYPISLSKAFNLAGYHLDYALEIFLKKLWLTDVSLFNNESEFISCINIDLIATNELNNSFSKVSGPKVSYPAYWQDNSINEGNYFLAYFDALGFKKLVESKTPVQVYQVYEHILKKAKVNKPYIVLQSEKDESSKSAYYSLPILAKVPFKYAYYSDTILFWAPGNMNCFSGFVAKCIDFYNAALKNGILLRGVITHGNAILNKSKNIFIGRPINEAACLEKEQKWSGVIFGESIYNHNCFSHLDNQLMMGGFTFQMKQVVEGKIYHIAMNWMSRLSNEEIKEYFNILKNLKHMAGSSAHYVNNTLLFLSYYLNCFQLNDIIRTNISIPLDFPVEIGEPLNEIRLDKNNMLRVFFIELRKKNVLAGFIFCMDPKTFEINPSLKDILIFVPINRVDEYETFILSGKKSTKSDEIEWINLIPFREIKAVYSFNYNHIIMGTQQTA